MDYLTEEEIKIAQTPYQVPKFAYIYYNDRREITSISPIKYDNLDYLEVTFDRAKDFLQGKKDFARYDLEYFRSNTDKVVNTTQRIRKSIIHEIPTVDTKNICDVTLIHNKDHWQIDLSSKVIDALQRQNLNSSIKFFVTKKSNPNFLINSLEIKAIDLLSKKTIKFSSKEEMFLDNISVYTYPEFDSYGLLKNGNN